VSPLAAVLVAALAGATMTPHYDDEAIAALESMEKAAAGQRTTRCAW